MSRVTGLVTIRLLTGKKLRYYMPGPPPSILVIEAPAEQADERGARIVCRRTDLDEYNQMTVEDLVRAGLLRKKEKEPSEEKTGNP